MKPFTDETRQLLSDALEQARQFGGALVGTEHLLLALTTHHEGFAATLEKHQITPEMLRESLKNYFGAPRRLVGGFSPRARRVLSKAQEEMLQSGDTRIEPWHVLVALLEEAEGPARDILSQLGFSPALQLQEAARVRSNEQDIRVFQDQLKSL